MDLMTALVVETGVNARRKARGNLLAFVLGVIGGGAKHISKSALRFGADNFEDQRNTW
jgi:hypothetical protein